MLGCLHSDRLLGSGPYAKGFRVKGLGFRVEGLGVIGVIRGYIGIMEKKMEATITRL